MLVDESDADAGGVQHIIYTSEKRERGRCCTCASRSEFAVSLGRHTTQ